MTKSKVAIVVANYYKDYTEKLLNGSTSVLDGEYDYEVFSVPGAWDTVYKVNSLVDSYDKFIVIGIICKGDTDHYEYISSAVSNGLIDITINKNIYIANCVLNVHSLDQAEKRCTPTNNKGEEAALALKDIFS
jgi:6,7-dimethyl-8-ribityllumazine synthase